MNVFNSTQIANTYDIYYQTELGKTVDNIEKEIILGLLNDISKERMLELGCGTGHWTEFFLNNNFEVTGIDISESMLNIAKLKNLNCELTIGNSENIPFKNSSFNMVSSITMLEFVENIDIVVQEIFRVLKTGGYLLIGCLNSESIIGINKDKDKTFKNANFLNINDIKMKFSQFQLLQIQSGVYLNDEYQIMDYSENYNSIAPVFIAALFQKQ